MANEKHYNAGFALSLLAVCIAALIHPAFAGEKFNVQALEFDSPLENTATLENFLNNNALQPGTYNTRVMIDGTVVDTCDITFEMSADKKRLVPILTKADLRELGIKVDTVPMLKDLRDEARADDLHRYVPEAGYTFDMLDQMLIVRMPQIYRQTQLNDIANPRSWDDGLPAAWVDYYYSGSTNHSDIGPDETNHYVNLNAGINLGAWRLRNNSMYSNTDGWDSANTWVQRDIAPLKSQLAIGETWTDGELFDSVQFTGIKLGTYTNMLSNREQGFAPTITGIARSDAKVTIKQNGYVIYQTFVSPGPFEINDLNQASAGNEFEVIVTEADGSEHSYIQNSAAVPILLRENSLKYSLAGGRYRSAGNGGEEPDFMQGTLAYGLPAGMTVYGGSLASNDYQSAMLGLGADLHAFGGISTDVTHARTRNINGNSAEGLSWRAQYSKRLSVTDTSLTLASYRYSTSDFYTFQEAINEWNDDQEEESELFSYRNQYNRRSSQQINVSQSLGEWGALYVNGRQQDYWHLDGKERTLNVGYSQTFDYFFMSLNYSQTKTPYYDTDRQVSLSLSVPLARWLPNATANYSVNHAQHDNTSHSVGISGTALEQNNLSYSLMQNYTTDDQGNGGSLSTQYSGSWGQAGLGYNYSPDNQQINYSLRGGVVAHPYGVTLAQSIGNSIALVHTEGASGVSITNGNGIRTDYFGNAIVPWLSDYRRNRITVNTETTADVDIPEAVQEVVPTNGAVVLAKFTSYVGARVLVQLTHHGKPIPYGAIVSLDKNHNAIVGDAGEVYLSGIQGQTTLLAKWGDSAGQQCQGTFNVPEEPQDSVLTLPVNCQ
ncbi:fimbria/pilus outer membrane usher protein [Enterobacter sp. ENT03]|uniref:fimbria/pilus outer membrane usher protein n=1 Tax=Enterobacter sp. ENT03 TaxID=2854780 RepID=UPI001C46B9FA|nr:fimbria/pilus outer membrane usher protein [Enterobacter sp. ENT03]MBV7407203.1 fimbrial biogenesis outer membrane usher protein [Enterobacter sp. ENT03]